MLAVHNAMTITRNPTSGTFEGTFRRKGIKPLHLSLRTTVRKVAQARHDAVQKLIRQGRTEMLDQLRRGVLTVERVEAMVEHHEPLSPIVGVHGALGGWGTVDATIDRYLEALRAHPNRAAGTYDLAGYQLKPFREFAYEGRRTGDRALDDVPRALILAFQTSYLDADRSPNVITNAMARVAAVWRWAVSEEAKDAAEQRRTSRVLYSPIDRTKLVRKWRPRERYLIEAEIDRVIAATPDPLMFLIYSGLGMGLRLGEVQHLRPHTDVDVALGTLSIREHDGWSPKTKRSTRTLPMTDDYRMIAKRHIERWASDHWMLPGLDPRRPMRAEVLQRHVKAIVERAGLASGRDTPEGVTFHVFRHSFASHAVMQGVDLYALAKLLGDTVETVEHTYARLSPEFKLRALSKVAAVIKLPTMRDL